MEFRPVPSFPGYEVSKCGKVRNTYRNTEPKGRDNGNGYVQIALGKRHAQSVTYVHRMVGEVWVEGYSPYLQVNHKDFNRKNNHADNLEWVTPLENMQWNIKKGRWPRPNALPLETVAKMQSMLEEGFNGKEIADELGVSKAAVCRFRKGQTYGPEKEKLSSRVRQLP